MADGHAVCLGLALGLTLACGSNSKDSGASTPTDAGVGGSAGIGGSAGSTSATIGPSGGTVVAPDGTKVEIPPGALNAPTPIAIELATSYPELGQSWTLKGSVYAFTPHGQEFALPVTVTVPSLNGEVLITSPPAGPWTTLATTKTAAGLAATVSHFSYFAPTSASASSCSPTWEIQPITTFSAIPEFRMAAGPSTLHLAISTVDHIHGQWSGGAWTLTPAFDWGADQPHLSVDASDSPHLCYQAATGTDTIHGMLGPAGWTVETVFTPPQQSPGHCAVVEDASGKHAVVHLTGLSPGIRILADTGSGWSVTQTDVPIGTYQLFGPPAVERHLGVFHMAFHWQFEGPPQYWNSQDLGLSPYLPYVPNSSSDAPDIAIDSTGAVHVGNSGAKKPGTDPDGVLDYGALMYAKLEQGAWTQETVFGFYPDVGGMGDATIALDAKDHVHFAVGVGHNTMVGLMHATNASGTWTNEIVDPVGFDQWSDYTRSEVAVIGSELHIVYVRPAGSGVELMHARRCVE